jgi:divalent metal cation (Fe/Co/Zn/Cd) transporter
MAALSLFVAGACVSIVEGIRKIAGGEHEGSPTVAYVVLGVAFVLESVSLSRALLQLREGAARWRLRPRTYLRVTTDTAVKAVTAEDVAALIGLVLAAAGLGLTEATGDAMWDGAASILIGVLLLGVAVTLVRVNSVLLIGRAAEPALEERMLEELRGMPAVVDVPVLLTSGPRPGGAPRRRPRPVHPGMHRRRHRRGGRRGRTAVPRPAPGRPEVFLDPTPRPEDERVSGSEAEMS